MSKLSSCLQLKLYGWIVGVLLVFNTRAQDIIHKKSGDEVKAKVTELTDTEVKYRKFENPEGPIYALKKSDVLLIMYANGQKEVMTQSNLSGVSKPLPSRTILFNPLGLLQFGPILQGEYKVSKQGYFAPHIRLPYLGLLYHLINVEDRGTVTLSPVALGIGAGYKYFIPTPKGAWYAGGALEYSFGSSKGDDGAEWKSKFSNIALMSNGGFRWRWPGNNRSLSVGAYAGFYSALSDNWWYVSTPSKKRDERSTSALVMLELSFGWEKK